MSTLKQIWLKPDFAMERRQCKNTGCLCNYINETRAEAALCNHAGKSMCSPKFLSEAHDCQLMIPCTDML